MTSATFAVLPKKSKSLPRDMISTKIFLPLHCPAQTHTDSTRVRSKCLIIQIIMVLLQLIRKPIVCIIKINSRQPLALLNQKVGLAYKKNNPPTYPPSSSSYFPFKFANASCVGPNPGLRSSCGCGIPKNDISRVAVGVASPEPVHKNLAFLEK